MVESLSIASQDLPELHNHSQNTPISLLSDAGLKELSNMLSLSQGVAAILVHPFYVENVTVWTIYTPDYRNRYNEYLQQLPKAMEVYRRRMFPIILFEEEESLPFLDQTLKKTGLDSQQVFLVPTKSGTPDPTTEALTRFSSRLFTHGLRKAIVAGSYMWIEPRRDRDSSSNMPKIVNQNSMSGCAGSTIECLLDQGIYAIPAFASFPRESKMKGYRRYP